LVAPKCPQVVLAGAPGAEEHLWHINNIFAKAQSVSREITGRDPTWRES
jgi:hypothetical protein